MAEYRDDKTRVGRAQLVRELKVTDQYPRSHTATGVIRRRFRVDANGKPEILPIKQLAVKQKPAPNPKRLQSLQLANQARQRKDRR